MRAVQRSGRRVRPALPPGRRPMVSRVIAKPVRAEASLKGDSGPGLRGQVSADAPGEDMVRPSAPCEPAFGAIPRRVRRAGPAPRVQRQAREEVLSSGDPGQRRPATAARLADQLGCEMSVTTSRLPPCSKTTRRTRRRGPAATASHLAGDTAARLRRLRWPPGPPSPGMRRRICPGSWVAVVGPSSSQLSESTGLTSSSTCSSAGCLVSRLRSAWGRSAGYLRACRSPWCGTARREPSSPRKHSTDVATRIDGEGHALGHRSDVLPSLSRR